MQNTSSITRVKLRVILITQDNMYGKKKHEEKSLIEDSIGKRGLKVLSGSGKGLIINHSGLSNEFL